MKCPYCTNENTSVLESRVTADSSGMRRRRECSKCGKRFTTYERVGNIDLKVIKRDGRKEEFDRAKLEKGIVKACTKRAIDEEEIQKVIDEIEMKLLNRKSTLVKSTDIGKMVLSRLKKMDAVAYLRFASVYLDFGNIGDFVEIIKKLEKSGDEFSLSPLLINK
jgi:transcriptional repressor NrdR